MTFLRLFAGCLIQLAPFAYLCFYPFQEQLRLSVQKTVSLTTAVLAGSSLLFAVSGTYLASILPGNHSLFQAVNIIFMLCLIPCLFWYVYAVRTNWRKKLFIFSFSLTSALSVTSICNAISTWIYLDGVSDGLPYKGGTIFLLLLTAALFLPLLRQLLKQGYLPIEKELTAREYTYLSGVSMLLFFILAGGLSFIDYRSLFESPLTLFLFFALFASVFIIYFLYFKQCFLIHEKYISENECQEMEYSMQILGKQYEKINENIDNSRRVRHDLRHILLTVQSFLEQEKTKKASEHIKKYLQEVQKYEMTKFCENQITNILLSHYHSIAQRKQIDFQVRIRMPAHPHVKESDLSVVLGNLLENAVEAAENTPQGQPRYIKLNIVCSQKVFVITVDNSFDGNVHMEKPGCYLSTKSPNRGTGLYSLVRMARKYHGTFQFEHDEKEFRSSLLLGALEIKPK